MPHSISLPLSDLRINNATCVVQNHVVFERSTGGGKFNTSRVLLYMTHPTNSMFRDRRSEPLSLRAQEARFRLARFSELKANWDSYNAEPPSEAAIHEAYKFIVILDRKGISPYFVTPGPNGDVLVQYKCDNGHEAEIWFDADGEKTMLLITPNKSPYEAALDMEFLLEHLRPQVGSKGHP